MSGLDGEVDGRLDGRVDGRADSRMGGGVDGRAPAPILRTVGLGLAYRSRWALRGCDLEVPGGRVVALVGPNGAGKTTLLHLAAGLMRPTEGSVEVLGGDPAHDVHLIGRIGLVAQDVPLYRSFTVADTLRFGRHLNPRWDDGPVLERLDELAIPLDQKVGSLSGGQRAQVALAVALAKRPELLLLDEPLASLDPLARRSLLQTLMRAAADGGTTIVLSSHLLAELERVCDHLVVVDRGRLLLAGDIDELLEGHAVAIGPSGSGSPAGVDAVLDEADDGRVTTMTVRLGGDAGRTVIDPRWLVQPIGLEELVLAYLGSRVDDRWPGDGPGRAPDLAVGERIGGRR